jgi:hypothetical protein
MLLLADAAPMLTRIGALAQWAESGKKETVTTTRQMTIEVIGNVDVGHAKSNRDYVPIHP